MTPSVWASEAFAPALQAIASDARHIISLLRSRHRGMASRLAQVASQVRSPTPDLAPSASRWSVVDGLLVGGSAHALGMSRDGQAEQELPASGVRRSGGGGRGGTPATCTEHAPAFYNITAEAPATDTTAAASFPDGHADARPDHDAGHSSRQG